MTQTTVGSVEGRAAPVRGDGAPHRHVAAGAAAAEKAAWVAENNYRSLTDKCREEFRGRQQVLEGLKSERTMLLSVAVIAGAVGALAAGLTTQAAWWLWDTFLAVLSVGWNALAVWWNS